MGHSNEILKSGGKLDPNNSVPCEPPTKEETEECQFCFRDVPLSLLMEGQAVGNDGLCTFEMSVPSCKNCTRSTIPWVTDDQVSDDFTDAILSIESRKKKEKEEMENGVTELDKLCLAHQQAAEEEKKAKARRLEIEGLIVAISDVKEEGSSITKTRYYKCTCTGKLTRKLDQEAWENIRDDIPLELQPVKTKVDIDLPKLRAIESANPELFKLVCNAIATKPAKTSIKVEVLS